MKISSGVITHAYCHLILTIHMQQDSMFLIAPDQSYSNFGMINVSHAMPSLLMRTCYPHHSLLWVVRWRSYEYGTQAWPWPLPGSEMPA